MMAQGDSSETSTAVATVGVAKKHAPTHTAVDAKQPRVSASTSTGTVFEVDSEEEELD